MSEAPRKKKRWTRTELLVRMNLLEAELHNRRFIGHQMANICFNLAQQGSEHAALMDCVRKQWDGIRRVEDR